MVAAFNQEPVSQPLAAKSSQRIRSPRLPESGQNSKFNPTA
jgi:hypothetical protein